MDSPWTAPITTYRACAGRLTARRLRRLRLEPLLPPAARVGHERAPDVERPLVVLPLLVELPLHAQDERAGPGHLDRLDVPCGAHATASSPVPGPAPPDGGSCRPPRGPRVLRQERPGSTSTGCVGWRALVARERRGDERPPPTWRPGGPRRTGELLEVAVEGAAERHVQDLASTTRRAPARPPRSRAARTTGRSRRGTAALEVVRMRHVPPVPPGLDVPAPASTRPSIRSIRSTRSSSRS